MKRKLLSIIISVMAMTAAYSQEVASKPYSRMLKNLLDHSVTETSVKEVNDKSTVFLDAREMNEFEVSKIQGARWVGYDDFSMDRLKGIAKDSEIVVYCSVGYRSEKVAEKLEKAGYTNVSNLYGGIFEWVNEGRVVVDSTDQKTQKVHAYNRAWGVWLKEGEKVY